MSPKCDSGPPPAFWANTAPPRATPSRWALQVFRRAHSGCRKLAHLPPTFARLLYFNLSQKFLLGNRIVPVEKNPVYLVLLPAIDLVYEQDLVWLPLEVGGDGGVIKSLLLEIIRKVALTLCHQFPIDSSFRKNRNQLLHLTSRQPWDGAELRALGTHRDHRPHLHGERNLHAVGCRVVLWRILLNATGQPVLLGQAPFHQCGGRANAPRRVWL